MKILKIIFLITLVCFSPLAAAKLLQIIHTNDLHSYFEGSKNGYGGYARIKTMVDKLRADATSKGIKTIFLDGGDFGEGSSYFFANRGLDSFRALDLLGIDAVVMGNHDYILNGKELRRHLYESNLKAHFLSANLIGRKKLGVEDKVKSYVDYDLDGMKIRIFGLTTSEIHFQYTLLPHGLLAPAIKTGVEIARKAKRDGVDFLIGVTHLGLAKDEKLISRTRSIDMVIGGHSHTRLDQPKMVRNIDGELIPAFQTGAHGTAIGSLIVDVLGNGEAKMIDYRLYDVSKDIAEDMSVKKFVDEAYINRERYFNRSWTEVIGFSEINFTGSLISLKHKIKSCWSRHIARATRLKAKTQLGIQFDNFQGEVVYAGVITYGDIIENFPHFRSWGDQGWKIARVKVSGVLLRQVIKFLSSPKRDIGVTIDGLQAQLPKSNSLVPYAFNGEFKLKQARIDGKKIRWHKYYSMAMPSEIIYAIGKISPKLRDLLLVNAQIVPDSSYWPLLETYIAKNSPIRCLED